MTAQSINFRPKKPNNVDQWIRPTGLIYLARTLFILIYSSNETTGVISNSPNNPTDHSYTMIFFAILASLASANAISHKFLFNTTLEFGTVSGPIVDAYGGSTLGTSIVHNLPSSSSQNSN
jgi:hypothetical protein